MTLDWLKRWDHYSPNGIALKDGESLRELSYSQFFQQACAGAAYLKAKFGIGKGDRVAILCEKPSTRSLLSADLVPVAVYQHPRITH